MTPLFQLGNQSFNIQTDRIEETTEGLILHGALVNVNLSTPLQSYYRHGWQSWSLAAWQDSDFELPVQKPAILHPLRTDPLYVNHPAPNGSWLGAVGFEDGNILLLGALGLEAHVALYDRRLHGWYEVPRMGHEAGGGEWFLGYGDELAVFARYAALLGERLGTSEKKPTPRVWCSWYSLYTAIDEPVLHRMFDELGDLPFDVIQVDDGWQVCVGDWRPNDKFPSGMEALAAKIRAAGRTAGLWLAPLLAVPSSSLFRQHPGWLLRDTDGKLVPAGFNWGEPLYALDITHPQVLERLAALMKQVRGWGFDYLKLDFLYAGALPGKRHADMPREAAYRQGLQVMRASLGADAYLLTCGAPILPSLGLCDAIRVGPDVDGAWETHRDAVLLYDPTSMGTRNAIRTTVNRLWLNPLVATDPDVAYFRSQHISMTDEQKRLKQDLALICNYKATSDLPQWMSADERKTLRAFLESTPEVQQTGRYRYTLDGREADFTPAIPLPDKPRGLDAILRSLIGWVANQGWALRLWDRMGKRALEKMKKSL